MDRNDKNKAETKPLPQREKDEPKERRSSAFNEQSTRDEKSTVNPEEENLEQDKDKHPSDD